MSRKVNGIVPTECVCFPRSGHHALTVVLKQYYGDRLNYCEQYLDEQSRIDVCEQTNFQKNHDFELSTEIRADRRYLVQIRDPLEALPSLWDLDQREGKHVGEWEQWAFEKLEYWRGFLVKWVLQPMPNRLIVRYSDLVSRPFEAITNVLEFMEGDGHTDALKLRCILATFPIARRRRRELPNTLIA